MCFRAPINAYIDIAQVTRHQGGIEDLFRESMATKELVVERPVVPTSIELSPVESDLENPNASPVKVPPVSAPSAARVLKPVSGYVEPSRLHR